MPKLKLLVKARAVRQIEAAAAWWQAKRPSAPGAIRLDLEAALQALLDHPAIGVLIANTGSPGARRLYLGRTGYFIYYRIRKDTLEVVAFWHASREPGPRV